MQLLYGFTIHITSVKYAISFYYNNKDDNVKKNVYMIKTWQTYYIFHVCVV